MDILILSMEFPPGPGGIGTLSFQAATYFSKLGWAVRVAAPQRHVSTIESNYFNLEQPFKIMSFKYKGPLVFEAINRFTKVFISIIKRKPTLILTIGWQTAILGKILSLMINKPLVVIGIGTEFLLSGVWGFTTRKVYENANRIIYISDFVRNLAENQGYRISKYSIINLGADDSIFKPELDIDNLKKKFNILKSQKILLTVGQVSSRKAQDVVIKALPTIINKFPDILYIIVGLPTQRESYQALAKAMGVGDKVIFTGKVPRNELPLYYNLADIFVMVSRLVNNGSVEGFGIAVVEAELCGKPAIVSKNSGLVEAIIPNVTALTVESDDFKSVADAVITLLTNDSLYESMSKAALEHARHYTWNKQMEILANELMKILE